MIRRGEVRCFRFATPDKLRPVLVLGRDDVLPSLSPIAESTVQSKVHHGSTTHQRRRSRHRLCRASGYSFVPVSRYVTSHGFDTAGGRRPETVEPVKPVAVNV